MPTENRSVQQFRYVFKQNKEPEETRTVTTFQQLFYGFDTPVMFLDTSVANLIFF